MRSENLTPKQMGVVEPCGAPTTQSKPCYAPTIQCEPCDAPITQSESHPNVYHSGTCDVPFVHPCA